MTNQEVHEEGYEKTRNPDGNWFLYNRSNESLRLAYLFLWNYSQRLYIGNPEVLDKTFFEDLLIFKVDLSDSGRDGSQNYERLMLTVQQELNYFINGASYPGNNHSGALSLGIKDSEYLDQLALTLGGLDGIVGFILAGNDNCSNQLLSELESSSYSINDGSDSTKSRALTLISLRNA